jgi:hypothetical protein
VACHRSSQSLQTTASVIASSGRTGDALESDFTHEICHIQESPAETIDPWNESLTSLERSNALKNSGIGRRFKGNAQWLAASWAHLLLSSTIVPHGRDC